MAENFLKESSLRAVLGPTNTGKTHYAMERMLSHKSGMIGFPLRLLARENYDRAIKIVGEKAVALITGEEKIIPVNAKYFCCTVEAMPIDKKVAFLSVDEIQLAGDQERGHVFTDRLLNARGTEETIFLGSEIIKPLMKSLLPKCKIEIRPRLSTLTYAGVRKITRLKPRSAIVTFSISEIYRIAELVRTQKGGAAVVMGSLSPRTRNSQVDLYQNGQVDFLIATDAIGMGLNLDIDHVAFAANSKFDGNVNRSLSANEIAQIAGRAGRSSKNGTFGIINDDLILNKKLVEMVENHDFPSLFKIWWRNSELDFTSVKGLIKSLEKTSPSNLLKKKGNALDLISLTNMSKLKLVTKNQTNQFVVSLLWDICQIPDFGNLYSDRHFNLLETLFNYLIKGKVDNDWMKNQIVSLNRLDGEIETLLYRIANIRTWTYITNKNNWINDHEFWQNETKGIEDKLSDELHERLTKRFIDKKIVILTKKLNEKISLEAKVKFDGKVFVEGQEVGFLKGFDFISEVSENENSSKILSAARKALPKEIEKRVNDFIQSSEEAIKLDEKGTILWMESSIGRLSKGNSIYNPIVLLNDLDMLMLDQKNKIREKCINSIKLKVLDVLAESIKLKGLNLRKSKEDLSLKITSKVNSIAFNVYEGLGSTLIKNIPFSLKKLSEDEKLTLAKLGLRIGTEVIYLPKLLKPISISLRSILWSVFNNSIPFQGPPAIGRVSCDIDKSLSSNYYHYIGYFPYKTFALRVDIAERIKVIIRHESKKGSFQINENMLSVGGATKEQMKEILKSMNFEIIHEIKSENDPDILIPFFDKKKNFKKKINNQNFKKLNKTKHYSEKRELKDSSPFDILKKLKI